MTTELQALFAESARDLFASEVNENTLRSAEDGTWPSALWKHVEESGYTTLFADDEIGATWSEAYPIVAAASDALAPIPLAETLIAGWLLQQAGIEQPEGALTIVPDASDLAQMRGVPWGGAVEHAVAVVPGALESSVVLYRIAQLRVTPGKNVADEPRDTLDAANVEPVESAPLLSNLPVDIAVMAAAVSDWRVETTSTQKLKKDGKSPPLLRLTENPDILSTIAHRSNDRPALVVGFAAETENIIENATAKRV